MATRKGDLVDRRGLIYGGHQNTKKSANSLVQREIDLRETAKALVDEPDEVAITEIQGDEATTYEVHVAQLDLGKVIGKQGRIAHAIRNLLKVAAMQENVRVNLEIG